MRLDKFICECTELTRSEAKLVLKRGLVRIEGRIEKNAAYKVDLTSNVELDGNKVTPRGLRYIMLNKPVDYICSTVDDVHLSICHLVDVDKAFDLHAAGRLDADTTGLVLLTDDGQWSHHITSPKKHCPKTYVVHLSEAITIAQIEQLQTGIMLRSEDKPTLPALVREISPMQIELTIVEGKYHQVKRMLAAVGNKVEQLHRLKVGNIVLDEQLAEGQWRYLSDVEVNSVIN